MAENSVTPRTANLAKAEEILDKNIDTVLMKSGGFGRYQWFLSSSYFLNNKSVMLIIIALAYL